MLFRWDEGVDSGDDGRDPVAFVESDVTLLEVLELFVPLRF